MKENKEDFLQRVLRECDDGNELMQSDREQWEELMAENEMDKHSSDLSEHTDTIYICRVMSAHLLDKLRREEWQRVIQESLPNESEDLLYQVLDIVSKLNEKELPQRYSYGGTMTKSDRGQWILYKY